MKYRGYSIAIWKILLSFAPCLIIKLILVMKRFIFVAFTATVLVYMMTACGSSWTIEGNNMTIIKCDNDTIAPAGSFIMLPDSLTE